MSNTLRVEKVISTLPSQLQPNTLYLVRVGEGIDLYVTDTTGSIAHKHNTSFYSSENIFNEQLSSFEVGTNISVNNDDNLLTAIGKLQAQVNDLKNRAESNETSIGDIDLLLTQILGT